MSWTAAQLPDLAGTVAVVTGANSGIGFHTARELAGHGATVVLACRDTQAAARAAAKLPGTTRIAPLDLASQASVQAFASAWTGPLDLLVNNAGVMNPPTYRTTVDGHELMFGTNHLGHFALTARLLPALLAAPAPRVVTVASIAHHGGTDRVLEANPDAGYKPEPYYGNSKLANVLFARELHRRATATGSRLVSTAAHPGISATGLVADPTGWARTRWCGPLLRWSCRCSSSPRARVPTRRCTRPPWRRRAATPVRPGSGRRAARSGRRG